MLAAIDLKDNFDLMTGEVGEVRTDRRLTPKVMLLERRLPQMLPQLFFGFGGVATQRASAWHALVDGRLRSLWHPPPTPDPSPPSAFAQGLRRTGGGEQVGIRCGFQIQNRTFLV